MAIGLRRKVRLDSRRERQGLTRRKNSDDKRPERARRDSRMAAKLNKQLADLNGAGLSPDVASWVAVQAGMPARKLSPEQLRALTA